MISYKYNIYHSKKTKYLDKMLRECCFVWNHALALQRRYHKLFGKYISGGKMQKHFSKRIKRNLLQTCMLTRPRKERRACVPGLRL